MCSVFVHVDWECSESPLSEESLYYLDEVLASVSYPELLCAANLWVVGRYNHFCVGTVFGSEELVSELGGSGRLDTCRVSSIAFCLEQMCREWEIAT